MHCPGELVVDKVRTTQRSVRLQSFAHQFEAGSIEKLRSEFCEVSILLE